MHNAKWLWECIQKTQRVQERPGMRRRSGMVIHFFPRMCQLAARSRSQKKSNTCNTHTFTLQQHHDSKNAVKRHHMVMHMQLGLDAVQLLIAWAWNSCHCWVPLLMMTHYDVKIKTLATNTRSQTKKLGLHQIIAGKFLSIPNQVGPTSQLLMRVSKYHVHSILWTMHCQYPQ